MPKPEIYETVKKSRILQVNYNAILQINRKKHMGSLGLFEALTGEFANGIPVEAISEKHSYAMALMSHLQLMFNTRIGSYPEKNYGLPPLIDTFAVLPSTTEEYTKILESAIYAGEPRIKKVIITGWSLNKKTCHLECCLICTLKINNEIVKYRFIMAGKNIVEPWTGGE